MFDRTAPDRADVRSERGFHYRMLALSPDGEGDWLVIPTTIPASPTYWAILVGHGREIRKGSAEGELLGYCMNLGDSYWPVEASLVANGYQALEAVNG